MWCPECGVANDGSVTLCENCGLDFAKYRERWQTTPGQDPTAVVAGANAPGAFTASPYAPVH